MSGTIGGLLISGASAWLDIPTAPRTREALLPLLGVAPIAAHTALKRHATGLSVAALDEHREVQADVFIVARAHADGAGMVRILDLEVPAPAVLVAQKPNGSDFSEWKGYGERTGFLQVKGDMRALLERAEDCEQAAAGEDARYYLAHLEACMRDFGAHAPKRSGVLRLVALDAHGNVAAAANFIPTDWLGLRNFCLRAFDAQLTAYAEGVLRAPAPSGSTAETVPVFEFIRWTEKPADDAVKVRIGDKIVAYGVVLPEPVSIVDRKKMPARVPVAGLPIFRANGEESKPATWSRS